MKTVPNQTATSDRKRLHFANLLAFGVLWIAMALNCPLYAAPVSPPRVLILDETVYQGATSQEAVAAQLAIPGCIVDVVSAANWALIPGTGLGGPTGYGFDSYRALILGDPQCTGDGVTYGTSSPGYLSALSVLNATKAVWTPAVAGNVILEGVDNALHSSLPGADKTLKRGIAFAVNDPTKTGLYYALSCYYDYTAPTPTPTLVPHLTGFGSFMVRNYPNTCFNDAHIVATHPVFTASPPLTDAELSNWYCSTHEGFDAWPPSFVVLAIALTNGAYTATDGSNGVPYILVRGEGVEVITTIELGPPHATNDLGTSHTVCATIATNVNPRIGVPVYFTITSGPNAVTNYTAVTDTNGTACFTYVGNGGLGTDYITAYYLDNFDRTNTSRTVTKLWVGACVGVGCDRVECESEGHWVYRFCVTNLTGAPLSTVTLQPQPGFTLSPSTLNFAPPLAPSQVTNVTVTVSGAPGTFCFRLIGESSAGTGPCIVPHCITLSECCTKIITNRLIYVNTIAGVSTYNYQVQIQNVTASTIRYVVFAPDQPCVSFVPSLVDLSLPAYGGPALLGPYGTRSFTVQVKISTPCPGPYTFTMTTLDTNVVGCCSTKGKLPKPICIKIDKPHDGTVIATNTALKISAVPVSIINPCRFLYVMFYEGTTLLGEATREPFEITIVPEVGVHQYMAVGILEDGEIDQSTPVTVTVIEPGMDEQPHQHEGANIEATVVGTDVLLAVPTLPGHQHEVQYKTNLAVGTWKTLQVIPGDGTVKTVSDAVTNDQSRFYRTVTGP